MVLPKQAQTFCSLKLSRDLYANKKALTRALWHAEALPSCCLETSHFWSPFWNICSSFRLKVILPLKNSSTGSVCINSLGTPWLPFPQGGKCHYLSLCASQHLRYVCFWQTWVSERTSTPSPTSAPVQSCFFALPPPLYPYPRLSHISTAFSSIQDLINGFLLTSSFLQSLLQKASLFLKLILQQSSPTQQNQRPT